MKLQMRFVVQTLAMAFCAAIAGFSYSLVTQANPATSYAIPLMSPRTVGSSTLRFLNPTLKSNPNEYDLGDALFGSVITRYISASGGLRPYTFAAPSLAAALGANSTLTLQPSGVITGLVSSLTVPANISFGVAVTGSTEKDILGTPVPASNQNFHLNLLPTGSQVFRFSHDHLATGVLGQRYLDRMDTIGAKGAVTFSIVPGSITLNGAQLGTGNSLEDAFGLSLSSDGTIYGQPLRTGLVTFKAHAVDSAQPARTALDRNNLIADQIFAFNIEDSGITSTDCTILSVSVKGDVAMVNADTVTFKAYMNFGGVSPLTLANQQFSFMFAGSTFSGYLNGAGVVTSRTGGPLIFPDGSRLKATVDSVNGTVSGTLSHANVGSGLNAFNIVTHSTKRAAFGISVYNLVVATNTIAFETKRVGTKYGLSYTIGKDQPLGGLFQMYNVRGIDGVDIAGNPGNAWYTKFLIAPRTGIDDTASLTGGLNNITVRIGTGFTQIIPVASLTTKGNGSIVLANKGTGQSLVSLSINPNSFSGTMVSNPLSTAVTGLNTAAVAGHGATNFFNMGLDINRAAPNASFHCEGAKAINTVPLSNWVDRVTKGP